MISPRLVVLSAGLACLAACSGAPADQPTANGVSLRNLTEAEVATEAPAGYAIEGTLIPTPSDTQSKHYLLTTRATLTGTVIAVTREERDGKVAYARSETDCAKRLFHVLGTGPRRSVAETHVAYDGPLRPIAGLPLRQELATFVCQRAGTPLATAT